MSEFRSEAAFSIVQMKIVFRFRFFLGGKPPLAPAYSSKAKPEEDRKYGIRSKLHYLKLHNRASPHMAQFLCHYGPLCGLQRLLPPNFEELRSSVVSQ